MLFYSWGARESRGEHFLSWTGANRGVLVLEGADDADGSWHMERRDPFADYRLVFNGAPKAIVAAGVSADTDQLDRKSTRLNSSHSQISYAVFCLKKKKKTR